MSAPQEQGEILTLGTYFAERERRNGRFLAEEMLDLFGERGVATSIMLRGIASFGPAHVERSTQSLTLSEDPPVTITAVDTPGRILPLADEVAAMTGRGVITLERGRLVPALGAGHHGDTVRLSLYLGRRQRVAGQPAYVAVCDVLHRLGFSSAETFLGVDGTVSGQRRKARFLSRNTDVPVMVVGVGGADQAGAAIDELRGLLTEPLFTVERIVLCKSDGKTLADPRDVTGAYVKLTVRTDEDSRHDGLPIHRALIRRLMDSEHASGATVLRALWGFHGAQRPHGDQPLQLARHVPVSTVIIDSPSNIAASYPIVDELTRQYGLVTCEAVPAMLALNYGQNVGSLHLP